MLAVRVVSTVVQYFGLTKLTSLNFIAQYFGLTKLMSLAFGYIADPNLQKALDYSRVASLIHPNAEAIIIFHASAMKCACDVKNRCVT